MNDDELEEVWELEDLGLLQSSLLGFLFCINNDRDVVKLTNPTGVVAP
jgi:hypothetical protein